MAVIFFMVHSAGQVETQPAL